LIDAARVSTVVDVAPPANEAQARALVPLLREDEAAVIEVWRELREAHGEKVTAQKIRAVVQSRIERDDRREARKLDRARDSTRVNGSPSPKPFKGQLDLDGHVYEGEPNNSRSDFVCPRCLHEWSGDPRAGDAVSDLERARAFDEKHPPKRTSAS